jgi:hypothetical protein
VAVPFPEEVEAVVIRGADDPGRFLGGLAERFRGNLPVDGATELGVADRGVEHDPGKLAEESRCLVDRVGRGVVELLEVMARPGVRLGQATVEQVDCLVGDVRQRLVEEGHQGRIPALLRHPLQGLTAGPPGDLGEPLEAVGVQAVERPAVDAGLPQEVDLLDAPQDGLRRVGGGGAAEPAKQGPSPDRIGNEQAVEPRLAGAGQ